MEDKVKDINLIGILKLKFKEDIAYSGILIYNINSKIVVFTNFKSYIPIFTEYFPSILFLNQTEIYLDLISDLKIIPDCYIVNSSGQIHPYLYGGACDLGLRIKTNTPVIGYTKQLLFGILKRISNNSEIFGLYKENLIIGYAIPKPNSKKYNYISVGNNISLETAKKVFLSIDLNLLSKLKQQLNSFINS